MARRRVSTQAFSWWTISASMACIACNSSRNPWRACLDVETMQAMLEPGAGSVNLFRSRRDVVSLLVIEAVSAFQASPRPSADLRSLSSRVAPFFRAAQTSSTHAIHRSNSAARCLKRPFGSIRDGSSCSGSDKMCICSARANAESDPPHSRSACMFYRNGVAC